MFLPKVSVVIPVYNGERYIGQTLNSVLNQTLQDFEIIVVNNDSTDKTVKIVKSFKDKRITLTSFSGGIGKTGAANYGIKKACGKFLQVFDADDVMCNFKLEYESKILEEKKDAGFVYSDAIIIDDDGHIQGPYFLPTREKRNVLMRFPKNQFSYNKLKKIDFIPSGSVLMKMSCAKEMNGFDESMEIGEDWDLWLRLAEAYPVEYLPIPTYLYRVHEKSIIGKAIIAKKLDRINKTIRAKIKEREKAKKKTLK